MNKFNFLLAFSLFLCITSYGYAQNISIINFFEWTGSKDGLKYEAMQIAYEDLDQDFSYKAKTRVRYNNHEGKLILVEFPSSFRFEKNENGYNLEYRPTGAAKFIKSDGVYYPDTFIAYFNSEGHFISGKKIDTKDLEKSTGNQKFTAFNNVDFSDSMEYMALVDRFFEQDESEYMNLVFYYN